MSNKTDEFHEKFSIIAIILVMFLIFFGAVLYKNGNPSGAAAVASMLQCK